MGPIVVRGLCAPTHEQLRETYTGR
jgi:hypothetical protein